METLSLIPSHLRGLAFRHLESLKEVMEMQGLPWPRHAQFENDLCKVLVCSDFIAHQLITDPHFFVELQLDSKLYAPQKTPNYEALLRKKLKKIENKEALMVALRQFRNQHMVRIAWRNITGLSTLSEISACLTALAEAIINKSLELLYGWLVRQYGHPVNQEGVAQKLLVIAMGKLGGGELNFSSDVDLIFAYPADVCMRHESNHQKEVCPETFFTQLGQELIKVLSTRTQEGFVYRVDMRLRPFGESGPLVMSDAALESYYQEQGREWERYAFVKARVIAGDRKPAQHLSLTLRPFVYRRYIDYGVFESLREMKALIESEVKSKGKQNDIKLGQGGIRQIEFIGQAFQLVRGGRDPLFQQREILNILNLLAQKGHLAKRICDKLSSAYIFLRNTENRLQMMQDHQVHQVPKEQLEQNRLAFSMGFDNLSSFQEELNTHCGTVANLFEVISAAPVPIDFTEASTEMNQTLVSLWTHSLSEKEALQTIARSGYLQPEVALELIDGFRTGRALAHLSVRGRARLDRLMPLIISLCGQMETPEEALKRLFSLIESIGKRSAYLALLVENPPIVRRLAKLCTASSWLSSQLCRYPLLLDEFLDPRRLYHPPTAKELSQEIQDRLRWIDVDDLEQQMESMRQFKLANVLRVAIADLMGEIPIKRVSDYLTAIAEVILQKALDIVWTQMVNRYGYPQIGPGIDADCEFAIVAYGKLAGLELGYSSDLDLVFLHKGEHPQLLTNGEKQISNEEFYIRLGQRLFNLLNTSTLSGSLYHIDLRLRPSGASGLLVTSIEAFSDYQKNAAWTWEHQALVRSRVVAGHLKVSRQFESLRREILARKRDCETLKKEIVAMRQKMRQSKSVKKIDSFDLKLDEGGIGDIEFIVQYGILQYTSKHPILIEYTDNLRQINSLVASGILLSTDGEKLREAYLAYRDAGHRLALHGEEAVVTNRQFLLHRENVVEVWNKLLGAPSNSTELKQQQM